MKTKIIFSVAWFCLCCLGLENVSATTYTLTLTAQGPGTVAANPNIANYPSNSVVTITATPNAGDFFTGWSGGTNSLMPSLNITMNQNYVITGSFSAFPTYSLTLTTNGQGGIVLSPAGPNYSSNTLVTATATPAAGWIFTGWTGSATGTANPLSFNMNTNNSLAGNFAQLPAISPQPVSVTNTPGAIISFSTGATGTAPLAYQWYFNGVGVPGATNSLLSLTNVQFSSAGAYQLQVTNNYGSVTSSVALLVLTNGFANPVSVCDEPDLRAAIAAGGWIQFGCNGTITLSSSITISNNVILDGSLVSATVSGGNAVRIFTVSPYGSLTISNLTLANGFIQNTNYNSPTNVAGGAIYNNGGTVNLTDCLLANNRAVIEYNADDNTLTNAYAQGGAIYNNDGTVNLTGSTFYGNGANVVLSYDIGQGGAIYSAGGTLYSANCTFSSNYCYQLGSIGSTTGLGGAICLGAGNADFESCNFTSNLASGAYTNVNILINAENLPANGGAIAQISGNLTVRLCQFTGNVAQGGSWANYLSSSEGGAIYCNGTANVINTTFLQNSAQAPTNLTTKLPVNNFGGGVYNSGTLVLSGDCLFSNIVYGPNSAFNYSGPGGGLGGGIYNAGQLFATNCTIVLNSARAGYGSQNYSSYPVLTNGVALGAGIYNATNAVAWLMNVTLASNLCNASGPVPINYYPSNGFSAGDQMANQQGGTFHVHNSLLAYTGTNGNAIGTITDGGYNFSSDGSANFSSGTSFNYTDPLLLALTNNGGPTLTMALSSGSPAIDYADSHGAPNSDQRGFARPFGAGYDVGAYEYGSTNLALMPMGLCIAGSGPNCSVNFMASPSHTYHLQWSTNLTSWTDLQVISGLVSYSNVVSNVSLQGGARKFYRVWYQ